MGNDVGKGTVKSRSGPHAVANCRVKSPHRRALVEPAIVVEPPGEGQPPDWVRGALADEIEDRGQVVHRVNGSDRRSLSSRMHQLPDTPTAAATGDLARTSASNRSTNPGARSGCRSNSPRTNAITFR